MSTRRRPAIRQQEALVRQFNERHPVGTRVRYWPGVLGGDSMAVSRTRSPARMLSGHTAIVWVDGLPDCLALTHVEVMADQAEEVSDG